MKFPPEGLSLRWYRELLDADQMQRAAWNSLVVAFWTTLIAVVLGTAASLAIARDTSRRARVLDTLFMSPLLLPALAFGLGRYLYARAEVQKAADAGALAAAQEVDVTAYQNEGRIVLKSSAAGVASTQSLRIRHGMRSNPTQKSSSRSTRTSSQRRR